MNLPSGFRLIWINLRSDQVIKICVFLLSFSSLITETTVFIIFRSGGCDQQRAANRGSRPAVGGFQSVAIRLKLRRTDSLTTVDSTSISLDTMLSNKR